jgi:SLOG family YspA-like protein
VKRILVTGSRDWEDLIAVQLALDEAQDSRFKSTVVVHGNARGVDTIAATIALCRGWQTEAHRAQDFSTPLVRNQHMVDLGADVCLAFATKWASGTGHCARRARKAGIPVIDYGVDTSMEARP